MSASVSSSGIISTTLAGVAANSNMTTTVASLLSPTTTTVAPSSVILDHGEVSPIFLQTKAAQGIAGAFVWVALFLTCQQNLSSEFLNLVTSPDRGTFLRA
ncbi:Uncharacterized protein GBIM_14735 [Gryllus bimaculatus]|nr:Uncharacterized protein GBIM_14735 [Gryllus bimaculatus]